MLAVWWRRILANPKASHVDMCGRREAGREQCYRSLHHRREEAPWVSSNSQNCNVRAVDIYDLIKNSFRSDVEVVEAESRVKVSGM